MLKKSLYKVIFFIIFSSVQSTIAESIEITRGNINPISIAINQFKLYNLADLKEANSIIEVIKNDLQNCGLFRHIPSVSFIEEKIGVDYKPLFVAWQQIKANLLLNGEIKNLNSDKLRVNFILWDTLLETQLLSETFDFPKKFWRRVAHKIADKIYKKITGYEGYFNTKIVYVSERGPHNKRIKRIAIMDQDGENHQYLTDGVNLVLTPRFSPDRKKILYLSYKNEIPQVFLLDLVTRKTSLVGNFRGMSFSPQFSPDGQNALISIAQNGMTHIYEINLLNNKKTQLTHTIGIHTSPSYLADGREILFHSDEDNSKQLYVMDRNGSNVRKITNTGTYAEPVWSSNNLIAFTRVSRDLGFTIGVMKYDGISTCSNERLITSGYLVERPSWAPNGRVILFTKGSKPSPYKPTRLNSLYTIDFTGHNERIIPTPYDASDGDWSKY